MRKLNNIPLWSIRYRSIVVSIFALVVAYGVLQLFVMDRQADPTIRPLQGAIVTKYGSGTALEVEQEVTNKLEAYLATFKEINREKTESESRPGLSNIKVELNPDVSDPTQFWSDLQLELNKRPFHGATIQNDWSKITQVILVVSSREHSPREVKRFADFIRLGVAKQEGVAGVRQIGEQTEEISITTSAEKLKLYQLDLENLLQGVAVSHQQQAGGSFADGGYNLPYTVGGTLHSVEAIKNIPIAVGLGKNIPLAAVADVTRVYSRQKMAIGTQGNAIMLGINLKAHINEVKIGEQLDERIALLRANLPKDIDIKKVVSEPEYVHYTMNQFSKEFLVVFIVITFVLMVSLPFRTAVVSSIAAPISIFMAIAILSLMGIPFQQVSLAGLILSLGLVVDDAIVVADNFLDLLRQGYSIRTAAWKSAHLLLRPLTLATVCIMVIFFPLAWFTVGLAKEFMITLPITVAVAVGASYLVAIFITPVLCFYTAKWELLRRKEIEVAHKESRWSKLLQNKYDKLIDWAFNNKRKVIVASFASTVAGIILLFFVKLVFFPNADIDKFNVLVNLPVNASLAQTRAVAAQLEKKIREDDGVQDVTTFLGVSAFRFHVTYAPAFADENFAQLFISTQDVASTRRLSRKYVDSLEGSIPGVDIQVRPLNFNQTEAPIEIHIAGNDLEVLKKIGAEICDSIRNIEGINYIRTSFGRDYTGLDVVAKSSVTGDFQVPKSAIGYVIQAASDGIPAGSFYENDEKVNLVLHLAKADGQGEGTGMVPVRSINGGMTTLGDAVNFRLKNHTATITHRNGERVLTVRAEAQKGITAFDVFRQVDKRVKAIKLPNGYTQTYGGEIATILENLPGLVTAILAGLFIIFLLTLFVYKSFVMAALVVLTFILSIPGAALGLFIMQYPLGFMAGVGLLALIAMVLRNAITKLEYAILYMKAGHGIEDACKEASKRRMRPVVLTSVVASLGLVTMIAGGSPMWAPLATVIAFGILYSVDKSLIVIPVLLSMWYKKPAARFTRPRRYAAISLFIIILFAVVPVKAQVLDLENCKAKALENNLGIKSNKEQVKYSMQSVTALRRSAAPKIAGNVYGFAAGAPVKDILVPYGGIGAIGVEQLLYAGGYNRLKTRGAELVQQAAQVDLDARINAVLFSTEKLFWQYQSAFAGMEVINTRARAIERNLFEIKEGIRAGTVQQEDSLLLTIALMENTVQCRQLTNQLKLLKARICFLMGVDTAGVEISTGQWSEKGEAVLTGSVNNTALHPAARQAILHTQQLQVEIDLLKAAGLPKIGLSGGPYYWLGSAGKGGGLLPQSSFISGYATIGLTVPIFDGGVKRTQMAALKSRLAATQYQEQLTAANLELARQELSAHIQTASETMQIAGEKEKAAQALLRLRQVQFGAGRISRKALLEAEADLQQATLELLKARSALSIEKARQFYQQEVTE
ncbi:efflux RND transporter permease subunit [uncultured Chitinophaga sp.]|uniref:efflux RND transporter permease subunit n=1 Tax=uncultured Chitinophaga sp. TaxID=339340 RepID=UPI0026200CC5|nr:efflux RND transporter permease subunit [uncultured Chitinophaga sp.]